MDPNTISIIVGTVIQLFRFSFPTAVIAALLYAIAHYVAPMAALVPFFGTVALIGAILCAPLIIMVLYIIIAAPIINRHKKKNHV